MIVASSGIYGADTEVLFNVLSICTTLFRNFCEVLVDVGYMDHILREIPCYSARTGNLRERFDV